MSDWTEVKRRVLELRQLGVSYEEIAKAVSGSHARHTPWWVYAQCHPEKSPAQKRAWREKHHPESLESEDNA